MTVFFAKEKHLEATAFRKTSGGNIEVFDYYENEYQVYLTEYNLDWYIVFKEPDSDDDSPIISRYESYLIENQLDIYRLNAAL